VELPGRTRPPHSRSALIVGLYTALAALAVVIGVARGDPDLYRLGGRSEPWKLFASPFLGVVVGLGVVFASRLCVHRFEWARRLHRDFRGLLGDLDARDIFVLAVASSVGEELLFRGALLPWIGLWPQAIVFALLHVGPGRRFLPWTLSAFFAGLLFSVLYLLLGDLGAPIVAHFTINYLNLSYIVRTELPAEVQ
jgi:membrane protease YdiL (CAAX protease family)